MIPDDEVKNVLDTNAQCSYWINLQLEPPESSDEPRKWGIILPQVITMGIMTHQAIERTWITASNAKQNRVGSELEAMMYALNGKEVDGPCVTPSHPDPIPPGKCLSITGILDKTNSGSFRTPSKASDQCNEDYEPPSCLIHHAESAAWLRAQATSEFPEIKHLAQ
ncbi:hypothetical protein BD769DRAFT_1662333 [Suillus cothurnatus]|nr:hypothetical protein BD769DRAFT_1662333 [Suillus cothurnatus]